jgi:hypothetical protein
MMPPATSLNWACHVCFSMHIQTVPTRKAHDSCGNGGILWRKIGNTVASKAYKYKLHSVYLKHATLGELREKKIPVINFSLSNLFSFKLSSFQFSVSLHLVLIQFSISFNLLVLFIFQFQFCNCLVYFVFTMQL